MRVKMRVDSYVGDHVTVTMFAGDGETLANIGVLRMHVGEYQAIGCALSMGAERMGTHLAVEHEDKVFKDEVERRVREEP